MADKLNQFKISSPHNQTIPARPAESSGATNTRGTQARQSAVTQSSKKKPSSLLLFQSCLNLPKALKPPQCNEPKQLLPMSNTKTFAETSLNLYIKKQPNQMSLRIIQKTFLTSRSVFYCDESLKVTRLIPFSHRNHIRLLWGIVEVSTPPLTANPELVEQFCNHFGDINHFKQHAKNSSAAKLVAQANFQTMRDACAGCINVGNHF
ncbi:hypothetical protein VP01_5619g1, partial [Puccinia sorghi]